ncbi:MAG: vWA domain-containing protein [Chloroflexota bacterium]
MSELLNLDLAANRQVVPVIDQPQLIYLLIQLTPGQAIAARRLPLNFTLLLDHSGSMAGDKLRTMKEAVKNIIDQLEPQDVLSIVTFESRTRVLTAAQPVAARDEIKRQVDQIREAGGTNMANGLREALTQARAFHGEGRVSRIVLLTDGEATDKEDDSRRLADQAGALGIPITGLGFGRDWNEDFLIDLADRSVLADPGSHSGLADYIPLPKDAVRIFQDVYQSMQVVAEQVSLTLRMVQGLEVRRVWQAAPLIRDLGRGVIQGRAIVVPAGQLELSGAAYLAEILLPPRPEGPVRIAQAEVTFAHPELGQQRASADLIVHYAPEPVSAPLDQHVMNIIEKVQAFRLQTQALQEAQQGNIDGATRKLRQAVTILLNQGEPELAITMQHEADRLEQSGELSGEGKKTILLTSRKTVRLSE